MSVDVHHVVLGDDVDEVALDDGNVRANPVEAAKVDVDNRELALFTANFQQLIVLLLCNDDHRLNLKSIREIHEYTYKNKQLRSMIKHHLIIKQRHKGSLSILLSKLIDNTYI